MRIAPPSDTGQEPTPTYTLSSALAALTVQECLSALPLCADRAGLLAADDIVATISMMARAQGQDLHSGGAGANETSGPVPRSSGRYPILIDVATDSAEPNSGILLGQVFGGAELARYYLSDSYDEITTVLADTSRL